MRWDWLLFFASLFVTGLGETWSLYVGAAGMTAAIVLAIAKLISSKGARQMTFMIGLAVSGVAFLTIAALMLRPTWFGLENAPSSHASKVGALDYTVKVECSWSAPPAHYREDKTLYLVEFQGVPRDGLKYTGQVAGPSAFRRSSDPFKSSPHYGDYWYRCDVQNQGTTPVRNIRIQFPAIYQLPEKTQSGVSSGQVIAHGFATSPGLDLAAGETDYFYFASASPAFVTVMIPPLATLQTNTDETIHTVKLVTVSGMKQGFALMPSTNPLGELPQLPKQPDKPEGK